MLILNSYGTNILYNFIQKCVEHMGKDYAKKILMESLAPAELNPVVKTDEDLAAWFIYNHKDKPAEMSTKIQNWAKDNFLEVISISLYIDGYAVADCHEAKVYNLLKIIGKAYSNTDNPKMIEVSKNKKRNLEYWDGIDNLSEEYIKNLSSFFGFDGNELDDNDIMEIAKEVTKKAVGILESEYGYQFPYLDENY